MDRNSGRRGSDDRRPFGGESNAPHRGSQGPSGGSSSTGSCSGGGGGHSDRGRGNDLSHGSRGPGTTGPPPPPETDGEPSNQWIFEKLVDREKARVKRDFGTADAIRDELFQLGVEIWESKGERTWRAKDGRTGPRPNHEGKCF